MAHLGQSPHGNGFPLWVTATVVLSMTALLIYNVIKFGPEGAPNSMVIGGVIGGYGAVNELLKRR